jgi:hypothetical protein
MCARQYADGTAVRFVDEIKIFYRQVGLWWWKTVMSRKNMTNMNTSKTSIEEKGNGGLPEDRSPGLKAILNGMDILLPD